MKNIKRQLVNYRNAMVMHMWNVKNKLQDTSGEGYVDTAIKILIAVVLGALLLAGLYLLNQDWYDVLMHTVLGQCILAATAAAIFISAGFVVKLTRPIEYRR